MRLKECFASLLLISSSLCLTLVTIEIFAFVYDLSYPAQARPWKEYRLSIPAPNENANYNIPKLVKENAAVEWETSLEFGFIPKDTHGEYINILDGYRKTTGNLFSARNKIFFFGGSTMMCTEVPDNLTLPSYFSRILLKANIFDYEVINVGATSISIRHQYNRLLDTKLKSGDIVVFMDGWNDIMQTLWHQNPNDTMISYNREQIAALGLIARFMLVLYEKFSDQSIFVRRFLNPYKPGHREVTLSDDYLREFFTNYLEAINSSSGWVSSKGGEFFHFLQPSLYTVKNMTNYEKKLLRNRYLNGGGSLSEQSGIRIANRGYELLRKASSLAYQSEINAFDITKAFDNRKSEIFLDSVHVNEHGNEILAKEIFEYIDKYYFQKL